MPATTERQAFEHEAREVLRQEIPEDLEWLPWKDLPALRWSDGDAVAPEVSKGWLVAAAQRVDPEPDDGLRQSAALFDPHDAATLGYWVLHRWIEHDTRFPELTEARRSELREIAERAAELARRLGRQGTVVDDRFRQLMRQEQNRAAPSALPHQGLLAIVGVCADSAVGPDVEQYLETWRQERPDQCRALRKMLAAIDAATVSR